MIKKFVVLANVFVIGAIIGGGVVGVAMVQTHAACTPGADEAARNAAAAKYFDTSKMKTKVGDEQHF